MIASRCTAAAQALLPPLAALLLLAPMHASADLYKWTDERGVTVLTNVPPPNPARVRDFEVVLKETKRPSQKPGTYSQEEATPTEQMLLERLDSIERRLAAQQYARDAAPPAPYSGVYYTTPPLPPPAYSYYPAYDPYYYSGYATFVSSFVVANRPFRSFGFRSHPHVTPHRGFSRSFSHMGRR